MRALAKKPTLLRRYLRLIEYLKKRMQDPLDGVLTMEEPVLSSRQRGSPVDRRCADVSVPPHDQPRRRKCATTSA
jgi:hypothetical protein